MCGYISTKWGTTQDRWDTTNAVTKHRNWRLQLTKLTLDMHHGIWDDRNAYVNGKTLLEQKEKETINIHRRVHAIYNDPPLLDKRYPAIQAVTLHDRLQWNNKQLTEWVTKINHQIRM